MAHRTVFEIAYEGPAVDDGIMDVRELAPSLLALGNLAENANKAIGDPDAQVKVFVKSSFKKGSFKITLEMIHTLSEQLKILLELQKAADPTQTILTYLGFISVSAGIGASLLKLLKYLKGRPINNATVLDNGKVRLEITGENGNFDYIEVEEETVKLYRDRAVRENLSKVLSPLEKEGIDKFSVREGEEVVESVGKKELPYFDIPENTQDDQVTTSSRKAFVNLIEVAFEDNLKWRLSDGENKFYASIADESFLNEMETGKSFRKGDILEIELETTQIATPKGIKNDHKVLKVLNHVSRPQQISIPFTNGDEKKD